MNKKMRYLASLISLKFISLDSNLAGAAVETLLFKHLGQQKRRGRVSRLKAGMILAPI